MKRIEVFPVRDKDYSRLSWFEFVHITGFDAKQAIKLYWIDAVAFNESPARFIFMINQIPRFVTNYFLRNWLA